MLARTFTCVSRRIAANIAKLPELVRANKNLLTWQVVALRSGDINAAAMDFGSGGRPRLSREYGSWGRKRRYGEYGWWGRHWLCRK